MSADSRGRLVVRAKLAAICLVAAAIIAIMLHILRGPVQAEPRGMPKRQDEVKERQVSVMLENATYLFLPRTGRCWAYFEEYSASARAPKRSLDEVRCSLARHYMSEYSLRLLEREEARLGPIK